MKSKCKGTNFEYFFTPNRKICIDDFEDMNVEMWINFFQY